jgi:hypothetical protein
MSLTGPNASPPDVEAFIRARVGPCPLCFESYAGVIAARHGGTLELGALKLRPERVCFLWSWGGHYVAPRAFIHYTREQLDEALSGGRRSRAYGLLYIDGTHEIHGDRPQLALYGRTEDDGPWELVEYPHTIDGRDYAFTLRVGAPGPSEAPPWARWAMRDMST